jgi:hypothetical protein
MKSIKESLKMMFQYYDNIKENSSKTKNIRIVSNDTFYFTILEEYDNNWKLIGYKKLFIIGVYIHDQKNWISGWYLFDKKDSNRSFEILKHSYIYSRPDKNIDYDHFKKMLLTPFIPHTNQLICETFLAVNTYFLKAPEIIIFSPKTHHIKLYNMTTEKETTLKNKNVTFYCVLFEDNYSSTR